MTTALWVVLIIGAMQFVSPLIASYWDRRQNRQIELYRRDPSVGVIPPPHRLTIFLLKHARYMLVIFDVGLGAFYLFLGFRQPEPVTRVAVLNVATGIGWLMVALVLLMMWTVSDYADNRINETRVMVDQALELLRAHTEILDKVVGDVSNDGESKTRSDKRGGKK